MARVVVSNLADADSAEILEFLAREVGYSTAARYAQAFDQLYERLARFPEGYRARPHLGARVRAAVLRPYLVVYRYAPDLDGVEIIRILHANRDITARLLASR